MTLRLRAFEPNGMSKDDDGFDVLDFIDHGTTCGRIQSLSTGGRDVSARYVEIGGVERPVLVAGLHLPLSASLPAAGHERGIGWEYLVESVNGLADCELLGRRYLVVEVPAKSFATSRRLDVVEIPQED